MSLSAPSRRSGSRRGGRGTAPSGCRPSSARAARCAPAPRRGCGGSCRGIASSSSTCWAASVALSDAADAADVQAEQVQRGDLRDERLGRGDRDLGAGVRVDDRVGLARDRGALRVADRERARAALARVLDGHERVHGLAGLADRDDERVGADHRVAVAELVRELDVDRARASTARARTCRPCRRRRRCRTRSMMMRLMPANSSSRPSSSGITTWPSRMRPRSVLATASGSSDDLLGHERRPAALVGGRGIPQHLERLDLDRVAGEVGDRDAVGRDRDDLVLADRERVAGVLDERGDIRAEEVLALAEPDHERRVAAGADDESGLVLVHREQREGAVEALHDRAERGDEVAAVRPVLAAEQHRGDLGVGLAAERVALGEQLGLDLGEVLDDAVVDDGELVVVGQVRVGVGVGGAAVRRPAGVADAGGAVGERVRRCRSSRRTPSLPARLRMPRSPSRVDDGDARGVVAAVLEPRQSGQEDGLALPRAHVSDDSTHAFNGRRRVMRGVCTNQVRLISGLRACAAAPARRCGRRPSRARASPGASSAARSLRGSAG